MRVGRRIMAPARLLGAAAALVSCCAMAGEARCVSGEEHARLQRVYDGYRERYGLAVVAQQLLDFDNAQRALEQRLATCRRSASSTQPARCEALARQIEARRGEQEALAERFEAAMGLQSYLATLELRLERPLCGTGDHAR
ncbi:MAG TPA: hypothetical protein VMJ14_15580 [Burkholderiales bacterium]|nr:hypothetical protein [Burkholderiales bacterium]